MLKHKMHTDDEAVCKLRVVIAAGIPGEFERLVKGCSRRLGQAQEVESERFGMVMLELLPSFVRQARIPETGIPETGIPE